MSLEKLDIKSTEIEEIDDTEEVVKPLNAAEPEVEDTRDIGKVNISSSNTTSTQEDEVGDTKIKIYTFKSDIISYIVKEKYSPSRLFQRYKRIFMNKFTTLKNEYSHIDDKEFAYWFFYAEAQKRAYAYLNYKKKFAFQMRAFEYCQNRIVISKVHNIKKKEMIFSLLKRYRQKYTKLIVTYYKELIRSVVELNFPAKDIKLISEPNIQYEFLATDDTMYWGDSKKDDFSYDIPQELMQYNLKNPKPLISLYTKSDKEEKEKLLSALDQNGIIYRRDFSNRKPKNNAHIQPMQIYNDNVFVGIDFTLSDDELSDYIKKLKKEYLSLPAFSRIKPSEQLKLVTLGVDFKKEKMMGNLLPDKSILQQFLETLFLYDTELFGYKKIDAEHNLPDVDGIAKVCLHSQNRKVYRNIISIMTSRWYLEQCAQLKNKVS